jgi:hypothetical protein
LKISQVNWKEMFYKHPVPETLLSCSFTTLSQIVA